MKKRLAAVLLTCALAMSCFSTGAQAEETGHSAGFIIASLGNEFFQAMYDKFIEVFEAHGWEASSSNGEADIPTQIQQIENYSAMGVDVIVVWPSEGSAVDDAVKKAMDNGVKVMEMINVGENWDVQLVSDEAKMMEYCNIMAAKWVDEAFPDAEDGSVNCVLVTQYLNETNKIQAEVAQHIEEYNSKIKLVGEYTVDEETSIAGVTAAEDICNLYPDVNLIVSPQGTVMLGVNQYLTSMNSPIKDYSKLGIFTCNGSGDELYSAIKASAEDGAPLRGSLVTSGVDRSMEDIFTIASGLVDGTIEAPYTFNPPNLVVNADTVEEMMETGDVTSYSTEDLDEFPVSLY